MTTREQFINKISKALGRENPPEAIPPFTWRHSVQKDLMKDMSRDELTHVFIERSREIGVSVFDAAKDTLNDTVRTAVRELGSGPVILAKDPLLDELNTVASLETDREVRVWDTEDSRKNNIHFTEKAVTGIAVARLALAESATVLHFSHEGCCRSVTLLPESVIYIIPKSCISPRLTQGMELLRRYKDDLPSSVSFVSGPSATSDIELVRVVGIHGPIRVVHIVVNGI